jgi:hypothetical protein
MTASAISAGAEGRPHVDGLQASEMSEKTSDLLETLYPPGAVEGALKRDPTILRSAP